MKISFESLYATHQFGTVSKKGERACSPFTANPWLTGAERGARTVRAHSQFRRLEINMYYWVVTSIQLLRHSAVLHCGCAACKHWPFLRALPERTQLSLPHQIRNNNHSDLNRTNSNRISKSCLQKQLSSRRFILYFSCKVWQVTIIFQIEL